MDKLKYLNKRRGLTMIEGIVAISLIAGFSSGLIKVGMDYNNYISEKAAAKDISQILRAVDSRISIDGYAYTYWPQVTSVNGQSDILDFIQRSFVAKTNPVCGRADGWIPQLEDEADRSFIDCKMWSSKLPYDSDMTIELETTDMGFLDVFSITLDLKDDDDTQDRFKKLHSIYEQLKKNDYTNKNGINSYHLVNDSTGVELSKIQCAQEGNDCAIKASWNKRGLPEKLRVNGTNSMIASNVSFKIDRRDRNNINNCQVWENNGSGVWTAKTVDCGIGLYSSSGFTTPVSVHLNTTNVSAQYAMLDKECNTYSITSPNEGGVTKNVNTVPCGLLKVAEGSPVEERIVMYTDQPVAENTHISDDLYSNNVRNASLVEVANDLINNYNSSSAEVAEFNVFGEATFDATVDFFENLIIGDVQATPSDLFTVYLTAEYLQTYSLLVRENAELMNVSVSNAIDDGDLQENLKVIGGITNKDKPDGSYDYADSNVHFVSNGNHKIDEECDFLGAVSVQESTGALLTCRKDWQNSNKLTWQSNYYGEIGVFETEHCPTGWNRIEDVHQRMMVGTGTYYEDYSPRVYYEVGDKGGEIAVQLTEDQMPEHLHATPKVDFICEACHDNVGLAKLRTGSSVFTNDSNRLSTKAGGDQAHNNMPNYLALTYCMYGEGDQLSPGQDDEGPLDPLWEPYPPEQSGWIDDSVTKYHQCGASYIVINEYGEEYTVEDCKLNQYMLFKEREIDRHSGTIRYTGNEWENWQTIDEKRMWGYYETIYDPADGSWVDRGTLYDCSENRQFYDGSDYYLIKDCKQDQYRGAQDYEQEIKFKDIRMLNGPYEETQTIIVEVKKKVASAGFDVDPSTLQITEGDSGTTVKLDITVRLSKAFDTDVTYRINTQDITTTSILSKTQNLIYDQFGNPFISVVDNNNGGRLMFDGGFPKYYNTYWNGATNFNSLPNQFKFMHNVIKWLGETHKARGKVLIYGDAIEGHNYSVHEGASSDFNTSIPGAVRIAGFTPVIKQASHSDWNGSKAHNRKVNLTLTEMNKYAAIIVMSSGGWESLTNDAANNFTTYVNNGGGVYIITDHDYFQKTGNQILQKFGSEFYGVVNRTVGHAAYRMYTIWDRLSGTIYGQNHMLWNGMTSNDYIHAGGSEGNVRLFTPIQDYVGMTQDILFRAGETSKTISVTINGDDLHENDETFKIILSNPEDGIIIGNSELIATIIDDDGSAKSMSLSCSPTSELKDGSCVSTKTSPLRVVEKLESQVVENLTGQVKVRYDKDGFVNAKTEIRDISFENTCNGTDVMSFINGYDAIEKDTPDMRQEVSINNASSKSIDSWTSFFTFKDGFVPKVNNCLGVQSGFDANIFFNADVETRIYSKKIECETGVFKDNMCIETTKESPKPECLGNYREENGQCVRN